jgi:hypothetical protein
MNLLTNTLIAAASLLAGLILSAIVFFVGIPWFLSLIKTTPPPPEPFVLPEDMQQKRIIIIAKRIEAIRTESDLYDDALPLMKMFEVDYPHAKDDIAEMHNRWNQKAREIFEGQEMY